MDIINQFPTHFLDFVHHLTLMQHIVLGLVALFFGVATGTVIGLFLAPILATIVYIAADAVIPPLMNHTSFVMPAFDKALAHEAVFLYIAFFVAILIVFLVKKAILAVTR